MRGLSFLAIALVAAGCRSEAPSAPVAPETPAAPDVPAAPVTLGVLGRGDFAPVRRTAEIAVRGSTAYTTTWGNSTTSTVNGTPFSFSPWYIWDVGTDVPRLVDSVRVDSASTLGDVQISDDGALLMIATERAAGGIVLYSLADPRRPVRVGRFLTTPSAGVHTAKFGRVNGRLYAFLSLDPQGSTPATLVIVDLAVPASPVQIFSRAIGTPFVHDTFVRNGYLFLALWDEGLALWDIGGGGRGTPSAPVELGRVLTANGKVHNVWWLQDPLTGAMRYAVVGEEGAGSIGASSSGDVHVVDVSAPAAMREVAFYRVPGAGTHNFSVDEASGFLYAAYYNGGVRVLDVRGDLSACTAAQKSEIRTGLSLCDLTKMGRERAVGLLGRGPVYIWGVQFQSGAVYASDMLNGIWKLRALTR